MSFRWIVLLLSFLVLLSACNSPTGDPAEQVLHATASWSQDTLVTKACQDLKITDVQVSTRYPPGCDKSVPGCLEMNEGQVILTVWLSAPSDCKLDALAEEVSMQKEVYLLSPSGKRVSRMLAGVNGNLLVLGFSLDQPGGAWLLVLGDNPPVKISAAE